MFYLLERLYKSGTWVHIGRYSTESEAVKNAVSTEFDNPQATDRWRVTECRQLYQLNSTN